MKKNESGYSPMLAHTYEKGSKKLVEYPVDVQPKLDGIRCIGTMDGLFSRKGNALDVPHIATAVRTALASLPIVLDGELYCHGENFNTITSWVKRNRPESKRLMYHAYDVVEFGLPWIERKQLLGDLLDSALETDPLIPLQSVPTRTVATETDMLALFDLWTSQGYEGVMLRNHRGMYVPKRSHDLLKVKAFLDDDFQIVGHKEGEGKAAGTVVWVCRTREQLSFSVRPACTYKMSAKLLENATDYYGQMLKVKYFALTPAGVPRFPVGLGIRMPEDV